MIDLFSPVDLCRCFSRKLVVLSVVAAPMTVGPVSTGMADQWVGGAPPVMANASAEIANASPDIANASPDIDRVLLRNGSVLSGHAERHGSQFRILRGTTCSEHRRKANANVENPLSRSGGDGEIWLPAVQVEKVGKSMDELYQHRLSQSQMRGFSGWIEVSHWWLDQIERSRADLLVRQRWLKEVDSQCAVAMEYRSDDSSLKRLIRRLEIVQNSLVDHSFTDQPVQLASHAEKPASEAAMLEHKSANTEIVDPERFEMFVTRVQPVLANRCRNCHQPGSSTNSDPSDRWVLDLPAGGRALGREASIINLKRMEQWLRTQGGEQMFMSYATSAHGSAEHPPLTPRHQSAIQWLGYFIQTLPKDPHFLSDGRADLVVSTESSGMQVVETVPPLRRIVGHESEVGNPSEIAEEPDRLFENRLQQVTSGETGLTIPVKRSRRALRRMPTIANPHDPKIFESLPTQGPLTP